MFQSIASIACSWLIVCVTSTAMAPSSATFVRSILSEAIAASAMTKMAMAAGMRRRAPTSLPGSPAGEPTDDQDPPPDVDAEERGEPPGANIGLVVGVQQEPRGVEDAAVA